MISIIIPTYNNLELFKRAYDSVISQDEKDVEVIVVDDSTTNDIQNYCLNLPVRYHHNSPPLGAVKNWNSGLKLAKGEFIILMHHDEALKNENFISSLLHCFKNGYDVVVSNIEVHLGNSVRKGLCPNWLKRLFIAHSYLLFVRNLVGPCACIAFKKEYIKYFDENLKWVVDLEWYYRLMNKRKVVFMQSNWITSMHGHKGQITKNLDICNQAKIDSMYMFDKYEHNIKVRCSLFVKKLVSRIVKLIR